MATRSLFNFMAKIMSLSNLDNIAFESNFNFRIQCCTFSELRSTEFFEVGCVFLNLFRHLFSETNAIKCFQECISTVLCKRAKNYRIFETAEIDRLLSDKTFGN